MMSVSAADANAKLARAVEDYDMLTARAAFHRRAAEQADIDRHLVLTHMDSVICNVENKEPGYDKHPDHELLAAAKKRAAIHDYTRRVRLVQWTDDFQGVRSAGLVLADEHNDLYSDETRDEMLVREARLDEWRLIRTKLTPVRGRPDDARLCERARTVPALISSDNAKKCKFPDQYVLIGQPNHRSCERHLPAEKR
jgi:hypothetical protein